MIFPISLNILLIKPLDLTSGLHNMLTTIHFVISHKPCVELCNLKVLVFPLGSYYNCKSFMSHKSCVGATVLNLK